MTSTTRLLDENEAALAKWSEREAFLKQGVNLGEDVAFDSAEVNTTSDINTNEFEKDIENKNNHTTGTTLANDLNELVAKNEPTKPAMLRLFELLRLFTAMSAFTMTSVEVIGIVLFKLEGLLNYIIQFYMVCMCLVIILIELEWKKTTSYLIAEGNLLNNWVGRGVIYSFLGFVGMQQYEATTSEEMNILGYVFAVSWLMIISGLIYFVLGICCCQSYSNKLRSDFEKQTQRSNDLKNVIKKHGIRDASSWDK